MTIEQENSSVFDTKTIRDIHLEIQEIYLADHLPWVIGYSGGKDSTATLQLIWFSLKELASEQLTKPIFVISSDTLVETPVIVDYIDQNLAAINKAAKEQNLPISAEKVMPQIKDTFWVNLLGRGYPAPNTEFRWCTDRMKIQPANRFILDKVAQFGEVIMVLGARISESSSRGQIINTRRQGLREGRTDKRDEDTRNNFDLTKINIRYDRLSRHSSLTRAWVFTPIEDFSTDDVWEYLLQVDSPWGNDNQQLAALYRSAQAGECPLVIDDSTPSCGNSRFGCWVCTVVTKDKSMTNLIDNGEDWMLPLLQFRDRLAQTQDPEKKGEVREYKRRDGRVKYKKDGGVIWGPYTLEFRRQLLRDLLETQKKVNNSPKGHGMELISVAELHEIRRLWITEERDWEDSLPVIVKETLGRDLQWVKDDVGLFKPRDKELLEKLCQDKDVPVGLVTKLLEMERHLQGMSRRASVQNKIRGIFAEDWRTRDEVLNNDNDLLGTFTESAR